MKVLTLRNLSDKIISALRKLNASKYCQKLNKKEEFIMTKENGVLKGPMTEEDLALLNENPAEFWDGVTTIGSSAFSSCESLTEIRIPEGVKKIEMCAFFRCGLTKIELPNTIEVIVGLAFSECRALTEIRIPNGVQEINPGTFFGCESLTKIELPNTIEEICTEAFSGCIALTEIKIPESVEEIGICAFEGCGKVILPVDGKEYKVDPRLFNEKPLEKVQDWCKKFERKGKVKTTLGVATESSSNSCIQAYDQQQGI